jgi:hypothetical protein
MFEHIGAKIKKIVKIFFVLWSIVGAFVIGYYLAARYNTLRYFSNSEVRLIAGSILAFVISTVAWILVVWLSSLLVYGFGELIDRAESIDKQLKMRNKAEYVSEEDITDTVHLIQCPKCGSAEDSRHYYCQKCGCILKER